MVAVGLWFPGVWSFSLLSFCSSQLIGGRSSALDFSASLVCTRVSAYLYSDRILLRFPITELLGRKPGEFFFSAYLSLALPGDFREIILHRPNFLTGSPLLSLCSRPLSKR